MATLDDKLLGEKTQYYYSSSEDERDPEDDENYSERDNAKESSTSHEFIPESELSASRYGATRVSK